MNQKGEQKSGEGQRKEKRKIRWRKEEIGGKIAGEITGVEEQGRKKGRRVTEK
jgi:hypothetical protein